MIENDQLCAELLTVIQKMLDSAQSMDVETQKIIYENLWDLYEVSE